MTDDLALDRALTENAIWQGWARDLAESLGLPTRGAVNVDQRNDLEREIRAVVQRSPLDRGALLAAVAEVGRKLAEAIHGGSKDVARAVLEHNAAAIEWRLAPSSEADALKAERDANTRLGQELATVIRDRDALAQSARSAFATVHALTRELADLKAATPEKEGRVEVLLLITAGKAVLEEQPGSLLYVRRLEWLRIAVKEAQAFLDRTKKEG